MSTEKNITLQHTRQGTYWPDLERCTLEGDILRVEKTQLKKEYEYSVLVTDEEGRLKELRANDTGEEFWLAYNPAIDRYYVRSKYPDKPFLMPQRTVGHRALFHHPSHTVIWVVPRNGSCTILASLLAAAKKQGNLLQPGKIWREKTASDHYFIEEKNVLSHPDQWIDYHHCIVYQDPELRCLRNMNYIMSANPAQLSIFFADTQTKITDINAFMDTYLALAEINEKNGTNSYDGSMKSQMWFHKTLPVSPEIIVELGDLERFINRELKIAPKKANLENAVYISLAAYTEERKKKVERLYEGDRLIETRFRDRLWN